MFVIGILTKPNIIFASKVGAYPRLPGLTFKYYTRLEGLAMDKIAKVFVLLVSYDGKKFYCIDTWSRPEKGRQMSDIDIDSSDDVEQIEKKFEKKFEEVNIFRCLCPLSTVVVTQLVIIRSRL
jgi:hypothetical protein